MEDFKKGTFPSRKTLPSFYQRSKGCLYVAGTSATAFTIMEQKIALTGENGASKEDSFVRKATLPKKGPT